MAIYEPELKDGGRRIAGCAFALQCGKRYF